MSRRLIPAIMTFVVLVSCFLAYSLFAIPALQGPASPSAEILRPAAAQIRQQAQVFGELINPVFPEGSWERSCEIVLRNEQIMLFVGGWKQLDDHRLEIVPCTMVLRPQGLKADSDPGNRTWIMQAPSGAILQMEKDADIRRGSLGRIVSAYIPGEVNVRCAESKPGAGDEVQLSTTHLQIGATQIWTPHDVRFRWGANYGAGSDLTIRFSNVQTRRASFDRLTQSLPSGLRSIELVRVERLHIESPPSQATGSGANAMGGPVEVTCDGSLKLDMMGGIARMSQNVNIERFSAGGQVDALACDELTARFTQLPDGSRQVFQFERIVATGEPARVSSSKVDAQSAQPRHHLAATRMEYDLESGEFMSGPGQYTAIMEAGTTAEVTWRQSMRWHAAGAGRQLTIDGPARCTFGAHQIAANRLRMWLDPALPPPPPSPHVNFTQQSPSQSPSPQRPARDGPAELPFRPRRVMADGHVQITTPQLTGSTERLDVLLQPPTRTGGSVVASPTATHSGGLRMSPPDNRGSSGRPSGRRSASPNPPQRLRVHSQTMRLLLEQSGDEFRLRDVTMEGNVRCGTAEPIAGERRPSVELQGNTLLLRDLGETAGVVTLVGTPARIRGRGFDITGPTINLDRTANRAWIDGAGSATVPLPSAIAAKYPRDAAFAYVVWQDEMSFDGRTIRCAKNVNIRGPAQLMRAAQLEVTLDRQIDLSQTGIQGPGFGLHRITASGGVTIESRALSTRGLESIDSAALERITMEYPAGDVVGVGPGWMETVRMGKPMGGLGKPAGGGDSLVYLRVEFQRQMQGNLTRREVTFSDRIFATFGPVKEWKDRVTARDPQSLSEGQLLMHCDRLSLFQIQNGRPGKAPVELQADGNATIESREFAARAGRMSYDQGKDLFVMEGAGRAPAQLWRQMRPGVPRQELSAKKIRFSPTTNTVHVDGMQMLNLNLGP